MRKECRLCGFGGQGIILAGIILAEAASIYQGYHVVQVQDYGPAARGDSSKSDVIISDDIIIYPKCSRLDLLVALSQHGYEENLPHLKRGGILVIDTDNVHAAKRGRMSQYPITQIAREQTGGALGANMVTLGILAAVSDLVTLENLEKAMLERVPPHTRELNQAALRAGYRVAQASRKAKKNAG